MSKTNEDCPKQLTKKSLVFYFTKLFLKKILICFKDILLFINKHVIIQIYDSNEYY